MTLGHGVFPLSPFYSFVITPSSHCSVELAHSARFSSVSFFLSGVLFLPFVLGICFPAQSKLEAVVSPAFPAPLALNFCIS
ncbi:hypothetical protein PDE_01845 [Penicillium oxalicum 114-2]|uniref:Uncharacterized protein n=1 Tax=Penicillium oxalicum (strain 114-2 / CGMCC 5302) TaxID=933388 RepID=S7Z8K5_PENO1|nr:hypothetical protein PDE_01845 [Penicillium oxalicum 114-2]